jgi:hypothetical protein
MWNLQQDASAITAVNLTTGPTMGQVFQHRKRIGDNLVAAATRDIDHKAHPTGVMLKTGVIESLLGWEKLHGLQLSFS